jgi:beta-glucosidase
LGTQSGNAIAEVLLGGYNPSGKLPMCFPRSEGQVPLYYNALNTGRPGPSEQVFWSHYIDESNTALYPFGHGLSYSNFEYSGLEITNSYAEDGKVRISVNLKNSSDIKGKEVVQLYLRDKVASISRPVKELKAFELVELEAGETQTIKFELSDPSLGFYNNQGEYIIEKGEFAVFIGGSSLTALESEFRIE